MDFNEIENNFEYNDNDFDHFDNDEFNISESRYIKPKKTRTKRINYKNAKKLAKEINFKELERVFVVVDGSFIFGDFIEAFILNHNIEVEEITISTLSLSQENVDSLENLIKANYIKKINIIVSDYFYSHERNNLIKYIYDKLDVDDKLQMAVCRTHCKITQIKTSGGKNIVIHGSVNLRSSDNLEQFVIEDDEDIYNFNQKYFNAILKRYKTINKSIKSKELWQVVAENTNT